MNSKKINNILMIKYFSIVVFCFIALAQVNGQRRYFDERYITTQHYITPVLINPGANGITGEKQLVFKYRNKWASFPGSPKTVMVNYDGPIANRVSFGALLMQDNNGALQTTKGQLSLAYTIDSPTNKLGFGLSGEYIQHKVSGSDLDNPLLDISDQTLLDRLDGSQFFDVTFGVYGIYEQKIKYGLSFPSLISSNLDESYDPTIDAGGFNYIFNVGYVIDFEEEDIILEPSIVVKQLMFVPSHVDVNLKAQFLDKRLTGGLTYAIGADERLGFLIGAKVNTLNLYYSYNVSRHEFQQYNNGSHEISIGIKFNDNKSVEKVEI